MGSTLMLRNFLRQINPPLMISAAVILSVAGLCCLWLRSSQRGGEYLRRIDSADRIAFRAMLATAAAFAFVYAYLSVWRWYKLLCGAWDLGIFWSLFENALHGRILQDYRGPHDHFDLGLGLYLPLYCLWRDARMLLVLQSAVIALGVWPLYLLAKEVSGRVVVASAVGIVYLLHPFLGTGTLYDFHALSLTPVMFFSLLLFMVKRRWGLYWLFLGLLFLVKESEAILSFGAGWYLIFEEPGSVARLKKAARDVAAWRFWREPWNVALLKKAARDVAAWRFWRDPLVVGAITVVLSTTWFFLASMVLLPRVSGAPYRHLVRYEGLLELVKVGITTVEGRTAAVAYLARVIAAFVFALLPTGFLLFRRWKALFFIFLPYFVVSILSRYAFQNVFMGHYTLTATTAVVGSFALATKGMKGFGGNEKPTVWPLFVVVVAVMTHVICSWPAQHRLYFPANHLYLEKSFNVLSMPLPLNEKRRDFYALDRYEKFFHDMRPLFPAGSAIATQNSLGAYFAAGYDLYDFKRKNLDVHADYYIFDLGRGDSLHTPPVVYTYLLERLSKDPKTVKLMDISSFGPDEHFVLFASGDKCLPFYQNLLAAHKREPENKSYITAINAVIRAMGIDHMLKVGVPDYVLPHVDELRREEALRREGSAAP